MSSYFLFMILFYVFIIIIIIIILLIIILLLLLFYYGCCLCCLLRSGPYATELAALFELPGCVGVMGGRPNASFFFVKVDMYTYIYMSISTIHYSFAWCLQFNSSIAQMLPGASGEPDQLLYFFNLNTYQQR